MPAPAPHLSGLGLIAGGDRGRGGPGGGDPGGGGPGGRGSGAAAWISLSECIELTGRLATLW